MCFLGTCIPMERSVLSVRALYTQSIIIQRSRPRCNLPCNNGFSTDMTDLSIRIQVPRKHSKWPIKVPRKLEDGVLMISNGTNSLRLALLYCQNFWRVYSWIAGLDHDIQWGELFLLRMYLWLTLRDQVIMAKGQKCCHEATQFEPFRWFLITFLEISRKG